MKVKGRNIKGTKYCIRGSKTLDGLDNQNKGFVLNTFCKGSFQAQGLTHKT